MKYSNILRSDLGLSKITDKDEFLDHRVIKTLWFTRTSNRTR